MRISDWSSDVCPSDLDNAINVSGAFNRVVAGKNIAEGLKLLDFFSIPRLRRVEKDEGTSVLIAGRKCIQNIHEVRTHEDAFFTHLSGFGDLTAISPKEAKCTLKFRNAFAHLASRSEEHTSELQSLMRISYAVIC